MNFEKLTQQQVKSILLDAKRKADQAKVVDTKSMVMDIKRQILSIIAASND